MASVDEVYRGYGVVHTDDCNICDIPEVKEVSRVKTIDKVLLCTMLLGVGMLVGIWLTWQPVDPLERAFEKYNHFRVYEDGSWTAQERDGNQVSGCIATAQCQD